MRRGARIVGRMLVVSLLAVSVPVWAQVCGDGNVDPGETCDPPNLAHGPNGQPICRTDCTSCGDGVVDAADVETCDYGPNLVCGGCLDICQERISPGGGWGGCPCALDAPAFAALRADIVATCDCTNTSSHRAFLRCARAKLDAVDPQLFVPPCRTTALRCLARSVCGKPGAVTCCRTNRNGHQRCVVKPDAAHCTATGGGSASLGATETCCDACP